MNKSVLTFLAAALFSVIGLGIAAWASMRTAELPVYVTWHGIGPDKWASIWLIRRHVDPDAQIAFLPYDTSPHAGIAFDIPGSSYMRDSSLTTFEVMLAALVDQNTPQAKSLDKMAHMLNEMEVSRWTIQESSQTGLMEQGFRDLQLRIGREDVPFACYMAFFDRVEAMLTRTEDGLLDETITAMDSTLCRLSDEDALVSKSLVDELQIEHVLTRMSSGENVIFVDTRERAEYNEFHIPGAVHIPLRNVSAETVAEITTADLVIPYCVKDFRGYEVARALASYGVDNVAILNPYGIRGWRSSGLPVTGSRSLTAAEAQIALSHCIKDPDTCLK